MQTTPMSLLSFLTSSKKLWDYKLKTEGCNFKGNKPLLAYGFQIVDDDDHVQQQQPYGQLTSMV